MNYLKDGMHNILNLMKILIIISIMMD